MHCDRTGESSTSRENDDACQTSPLRPAMADEHPILRSLLDSLNAMNQRLNVIENVLIVPSDPAQPAATPQNGREGHAHVLPQHQGSPTNTPTGAGSSSSNRRPLPSAAPPLQTTPQSTQHYATATTPTSAVPSPISFHRPPSGAPTSSYSSYAAEPPKPPPSSAPAVKRPSQPLRSQNERVKFEDENSDEDLEGNDKDLPDMDDDHLSDKDEEDEEEDDDDDDEDDDQQGGGRGSNNGEAGGSKGGGEGSTLPKELQPTGVSQSRLEALPEGFVVSGRATLQEELDGWTIPRGYSMRINGTRSHGRRQKIRMVCFRGGRSRLRPKEEEAKRERERERLLLFPDLPPRRRKPTTDRISKKCECPFRFELVEVCPGADRYAVHYTNDDHTQHNHAAADLMLDPRARKLPRALKAEVDQWLRDASTLGTGGNSKSSSSSNSDNNQNNSSGGGPGWTIAKIQAELQRRGYGHVLDFDLRNRKRALLHKDRMAQLKREGAGGGGGGGGGSSTGGDTPTAIAT